MWLLLFWAMTVFDAAADRSPDAPTPAGTASTVAQWESAVRDDPMAPLPRIELGRLLLESGQRLDEAALHLARAAELAPSNPRVHALLGLLAEEQHDPVAARRAYERALALRDDLDDARYRLAGLLLAAGNAEAAAEAYRRFVERHPKDSGARLQLATALVAAKRLKEAERLLRALDREAPSSVARRHLADLLELQGRTGEAQRLREKDEGPARKLRSLKPSVR